MLPFIKIRILDDCTEIKVYKCYNLIDDSMILLHVLLPTKNIHFCICDSDSCFRRQFRTKINFYINI